MGGLMSRNQSDRQKQPNSRESDDTQFSPDERPSSVRKRNIFFYGTHEMHLSSLNEEADLRRHFNGCGKNPGHTQFIPINEFQIDHLPTGHRDTDMCQFIKAVAALTVRIDVKMTSPNRPQFWPETSSAYPFHNISGKDVMRTGSGEMRVLKYTDGRGFDGCGKTRDLLGYEFAKRDKTCPCEKCQRSGEPSAVWWEIVVHTAMHVVFDEIEARHTSCRLFYDEPDCPAVRIENFSVDFTDLVRDSCVLKYATCEELGEKLYAIVVHAYGLWRAVWKKYARSERDVGLAFIVSHPHGCPKQVSFGQLSCVYKLREISPCHDLTKLTYTAGTCPGTSGARVYCPGLGTSHVHSGTMRNEVNYSGTGLFRK